MRAIWKPSAFVCLAALCIAPSIVLAQRQLIEAEDFSTSYDWGGAAIQALPLSGCSGGYFLYGLDTPGEWVEYELGVNASGVFGFTMTCRGTLNRPYALKLAFFPAGGGPASTVEFSFVGEGFG